MSNTQAGQYRDLLLWQQPTTTTSTTTGDRRGTFADETTGTKIWALVKVGTTDEGEALGRSVQQWRVSIRVRRHPAIVPGDRLIDGRRSAIYSVETVVWDGRETLVTGRRSQGVR